MRNVRRIWYWEGANTLSQLAVDGTQLPDKCKFTAVFGPFAKGYILGRFLTLTPCYIAKQESHFAHGETLSEAVFEVTLKHSRTCRNMAEKLSEN